MLDQLGYQSLLQARHLYHLAWGIGYAGLASITTHGLERTTSRYNGLWVSRARHVYMGNLAYVRDLFGVERYSDLSWALLRIDVTQLEPSRINPDEDHFTTSNYPDLSHNRVGDKHACQHFQRPFPPTAWIFDWAKYLKIGPVPSLGEWADAIDLGSNPAETRYSISKGSLAYDGVVPASAIQPVKTSWKADPC